MSAKGHSGAINERVVDTYKPMQEPTWCDLMINEIVVDTHQGQLQQLYSCRPYKWSQCALFVSHNCLHIYNYMKVHIPQNNCKILLKIICRTIALPRTVYARTCTRACGGTALARFSRKNVTRATMCVRMMHRRNCAHSKTFRMYYKWMATKERM